MRTLLTAALFMFYFIKFGQSFLTKQRSISPGGFKKLLAPTAMKNLASVSFFSPTQQKIVTSRFAETLTTPAENATATLDTPLGTEIVVDSEEFFKPDRDLHEYRYIRLQNNLKVFIVSTQKASSAEENAAKVEAASVHVQAGHFDDTIAGLAHFHEHML